MENRLKDVQTGPSRGHSEMDPVLDYISLLGLHSFEVFSQLPVASRQSALMGIIQESL